MESPGSLCGFIISLNHWHDINMTQFAQELLQTFSTSIGEIALVPSTGGVFVVKMKYLTGSSTSENENAEVKTAILWDRKTEGGFPETKVPGPVLMEDIEVIIG